MGPVRRCDLKKPQHNLHSLFVLVLFLFVLSASPLRSSPLRCKSSAPSPRSRSALHLRLNRDKPRQPPPPPLALFEENASSITTSSSPSSTPLSISRSDPSPRSSLFSAGSALASLIAAASVVPSLGSFLKLLATGILQAEGMEGQPKIENHQATSSSTPAQKTEEQIDTGPSAVGMIDSLQQQYHKIKEHAETYPYVWASYIVVYGGFGLWTAYRWRKLRNTESRVRTLQERLRKLVEAEESANATKVVEKAFASSEKLSK